MSDPEVTDMNNRSDLGAYMHPCEACSGTGGDGRDGVGGADVVHLRAYITREFADIPPITLSSTPPDSPNGLYKLYVEALGDKRETEEESNG